MSVVISKDLNGRATRFVNSQLEAGGALARAVLSVCGPVTHASAPLPAALDPNSLTDFERGGVTSLEATTNWLVPELRKLHPDSSKFSLLVEDSWAKPSDAPESSREQRLQLLGDDCLVYALTGDQLSELALKDLFKSVRSFCFSAFVLETANLPVSGMAVSELAKHVKRVLVSAFDRDGLIIADWA